MPHSTKAVQVERRFRETANKKAAKFEQSKDTCHPSRKAEGVQLKVSAAGLAEIDPAGDWSIESVPLPKLGTEHVRSGAAFEKDLAPHEAWIRVMSDAFLPCLLEQARSRPGGEDLTKEDALRYMIALVAIGLKQTPREHDLWHEDADLPGIVGCAYVRDLLSRDTWLRFKSAFSGDRSALTAAFNTTASPGNFVAPNRNINFGEGGRPSHMPMHDEMRWLCSVDSTYWCFHLDWATEWNTKDRDPESTCLRQVLDSAGLLHEWLDGFPAEYTYFLESRWGSLRALRELEKLGIGTVCSLGATAAPHLLLAWMRRDLQRLQWRRIFHRASGARLLVLRPRRNAFLSLLTNCDHTDAVTISRKDAAKSVAEVRAPVTQAHFNKYKCSGDMWSRMVLAYDHMANCGSVEIATTQTLIHALTVQAFTY